MVQAAKEDLLRAGYPEYTRLGKIVDKTPEEMEELLGNGDVTITLSKR